MLNLIGDPLIDTIKQMNSSDVEFLSGLELESMWQAEELSSGDNVTVAKVMENMLSLQNVDLVLHLFRVTNSELLRKDGMKGGIVYNSKLFDQSTVVMIFDCFKNLLEIIANPPTHPKAARAGSGRTDRGLKATVNLKSRQTSLHNVSRHRPQGMETRRSSSGWWTRAATDT